MNKMCLLQHVRGSMTNFEPLTEESFSKIAEDGLTLDEVRNTLAAAGFDAAKIIVDPERVLYNAYYADYESGLYFAVPMSGEEMRRQCERMRKLLETGSGFQYLEKRAWKHYYRVNVPTPLQIMDFQKRYRTIEPERVFEVWSYIHQHMDYANNQWKPEVLEYVFDHAPKEKELPLNENGMVTLYRGNGTLSQRPEQAISWTTNRINALWFANHTGTGQAVYQAEIPPDKVVCYFEGYRNENEVIVRPNTVLNIRAVDLFPVEQESMVRLVSSALPDWMQYGPSAADLGYLSEGLFDFHGRSHILRVLLLSLIYFYNSGEKLDQRDKDILIYFALMHDVGRTNDEKDASHGKKSVHKIEEQHLEIPGLLLSGRQKELAYLIIRYHSRPDEDGYAAIREKRKLSKEEAARWRHLYDICKDMDGLDRVRFHGLDFARLRTDYAKKLPLIAGALLKEDVEGFLDNQENEQAVHEKGREQ